MANKIDVAHRLETHRAEQNAAPLVNPESDACGYLARKLIQRNIGLMPTVIWNDAAVSLRRGINDGEESGVFIIVTKTDVAHAAIAVSGASTGPPIV